MRLDLIQLVGGARVGLALLLDDIWKVDVHLLRRDLIGEVGDVVQVSQLVLSLCFDSQLLVAKERVQFVLGACCLTATALTL